MDTLLTGKQNTLTNPVTATSAANTDLETYVLGQLSTKVNLSRIYGTFTNSNQIYMNDISGSI